MNKVTEITDSYHRDKMAQHREEWKTVGVVTTSVTVPAHLAVFLRAQCTFESGKLLLEVIDNHDTAAIEVFANRRPRAGIDETRIAMLDKEVREGGTGSDEMDRINSLVREMAHAKLEGNIAEKDGRSTSMYYWFAREYALSYCLRGCVVMLEERINGRAM